MYSFPIFSEFWLQNCNLYLDVKQLWSKQSTVTSTLCWKLSLYNQHLLQPTSHTEHALRFNPYIPLL